MVYVGIHRHSHHRRHDHRTARLPGTIGCSWGWTPVDPTSLDPYFQEDGRPGPELLCSLRRQLHLDSRAIIPGRRKIRNVVTVGGTDLVTAERRAEPGVLKPPGSTAAAASAPTISPFQSWQQLAGVINSTNKGSTTYRNGPDVSANANFTFYVCADQTTCTANSYGGTSFAAPMWAAYIALVNQQLAMNSQPAIGFINPNHLRAKRHPAAPLRRLCVKLPRHHQRHLRQLLRRHRLRPRHRMGQPEHRPLRRAHRVRRQPQASRSLQRPSPSCRAPVEPPPSPARPFGGYSSTITLVALRPALRASRVSYGTNPFGPSGSTTITFIASATAATGTYHRNRHRNRQRHDG